MKPLLLLLGLSFSVPAFAQTILPAPGGLGTVTSVTADTPNSTLTLGGTNPVTTSGTIHFDLNLSHANTWAGQQTFVAPVLGAASATSVALTGGTVTNVTTPSAGTDAANKAYVDNVAAGLNPAVAVQAATTQASDTSSFTYLNGASGIGATLTGPVNTAFAPDGFTFTAIGQRVLIKNDTVSISGAHNGVYSVTQVQTAILPVILTRTLDYDQPSDMNNTGSIPIVNGTANAQTSWLLTSSIATVGTDPLTFTQYTLNPTTIVTGPASATDGHFAIYSGSTGKLLKDTLAAPGTAAVQNTGTSGATLPFLNGANTWSGTQTFGAVIGGTNPQSGTTYTLAATDCGKTVIITNASAITLTTLNSLSIGCAVAVEQGGAGQITVANGSGATLTSAHSYTKTFNAAGAIIGLFVDTNAGGTAAHLVLTGDGA